MKKIPKDFMKDVINHDRADDKPEDNPFKKEKLDEEFPSLNRKDIMLGQKWFPQNDILLYCLDKQRVKEAIDKLTITDNNCNVDGTQGFIPANQLKKELGIE